MSYGQELDQNFPTDSDKIVGIFDSVLSNQNNINHEKESLGATYV